MSKKTVNKPPLEISALSFVVAADIMVGHFNREALDPIERPDGSDPRVKMNGEENVYYNIGAFYQLGSRVSQSAYNLQYSKERLDNVDRAAQDELDRNGHDSPIWRDLSQKAEQAFASWLNAKMFFDIDVDVFDRLSGFTWNAGAVDPKDPYGIKWYANEKTRRSTKETAPKVKAITPDEAKAKRARMLAELEDQQRQPLAAE